ncbi:MAG: hypothetical protein KAR21_12390, partial [Spirochaetales bacterium]|nr:hypothetical protein [Spirochaetales bacterium]
MKKFRQPEAWWGAVPIALFLGIWEISSRLHIGSGSFIIPPFSTILTEFWYLSVSGVLGSNFLSSLTRVMIGFSTGSIAGLSIGILMGWNNAANTALNPIISLLYPIPALGWLPLLMLLLGIGEVLPIAIIFICSFFP